MGKGKPTLVALTFHSKFKWFGDHSVKSSSILIFITFLGFPSTVEFTQVNKNKNHWRSSKINTLSSICIQEEFHIFLNVGVFVIGFLSFFRFTSFFAGSSHSFRRNVGKMRGFPVSMTLNGTFFPESIVSLKNWDSIQRFPEEAHSEYLTVFHSVRGTPVL